MRTNVRARPVTTTNHHGLAVPVLTPEKELRRTVMSMMLWEDGFYESGEDAATRVKNLIKQVPFAVAAQTAIDAREKFKLRHAPLLVLREIVRHHGGRQVGDLIARVIQRPDELGEFLSIYWKERADAPLTNQMKIGLARAIKKFNEYSLAKYNSADAAVRLRDVLFLTHARPREADPKHPYTKKERKLERAGKVEFKLEEHEKLFQRISENALVTPDTWETELSAGADKAETFTRLIRENKLGALALLRNLRGMIEAGVKDDVIRAALTHMKTERVLPFRFITAAKYAPRFEPQLETAMLHCVASLEKLPGNTALLVDHSCSMDQAVSAKSEVTRYQAAAALAMVLREVSDTCRIFTFSTDCIEIPPRRGFGMYDALNKVRKPNSTLLGKAVRQVYDEFPECDRIVVITDEQSSDRPPHPQGRGYIINVATNQNGIGYGPWVTINGWSEAVIDYIREYERE